MPSIVTQNISQAVAQAVSPSRAQPLAAALQARSPSRAELRQANAAATNQVATNARSSKDKAPSIPKKVDDTYSPQTLKKKAKENESAPAADSTGARSSAQLASDANGEQTISVLV